GISDFDLNHSNPPIDEDELSPLHAPRLRGALFGGHAGYNWQWAQRGVVGLEIDYSAANIKRTQAATPDAFIDIGEIDRRRLTAKLDSLASARARVGVLVGPEFLLYGTGGAAWGHTKFTDTVEEVFLSGDAAARVAVSRANANHFGWVAGAGAEWKLWNSGLMLRVEYLHYGFGSASLAFDTTATTFTGTGSVPSKGTSFNLPLERLTTAVVRAGLSYKFGGPQ